MTPQQQAYRGSEEAGRIAKAGHTSPSEALAMGMLQLMDGAALSKDETIFACATAMAGTMFGLNKDEQVVAAITASRLSLILFQSLNARMTSTLKTEGAPI